MKDDMPVQRMEPEDPRLNKPTGKVWTDWLCDWDKFRREAVKDFCVAILSNPAWEKHFEASSKNLQFQTAYFKENVVGNAIAYADYMIEKLREN